MKKLLIVLAAVFISASSLHAQKKDNGNWEKIAEATVNFKLDKDKVPVSQAGNYSSVRIKSTDAPVHVKNLVIEYVDGDTETVAVNRDFKAGAVSPAIKLEKAQNRIKEMTITYRTVPNWQGDRANVEVWAMR